MRWTDAILHRPPAAPALPSLPSLPLSRNVLSYRHLFHAGNFADVFKHALLARLLIALGAKEKPYCYLDTHAGTGRYDLGHEWAWKTREFENGIGRLWDRKDIPAALAPYLDVVRSRESEGQAALLPRLAADRAEAAPARRPHPAHGTQQDRLRRARSASSGASATWRCT